MADVDSGPTERRTVAGSPPPGPPQSSAPARAYEENAERLYAVACAFMSEAAAADLLVAIATDLANELAASGYRRYADLLSLRLTYSRILADPHARPPRDLAAAGLTLAETFSLLLRDRFECSCAQIAAAVDASEGSIRTRLERARARLYPGSAEPASSGAASRPAAAPVAAAPAASAGHLCIKAREQIEDWNIATARLGQFTTPFAVTRAVGDCPACEQILERRLSSLAHFRELRLPQLPERLKAFPVSPLLVREGRRVLLNWSAAPWYVKALFEGLLATTLVLGIVLSIPRIKSVYEFWLERRLDLYSVAELATGLSTSHSEAPPESAPTAASSKSGASGLAGGPAKATDSSGNAALSDADSAEQVAIKSETEFSGREAALPASDKIYRVLIKTDSPESVKDQVMQLLTNAHFEAADTDNPPGSELPGGVIFDVYVPFKSYKTLIGGLKHVGQPWFITLRSKEHMIPGKAHLKIWLQRI